MRRPPRMVAAIVVVIFLILLGALAFWQQLFPGPLPTGVTPQAP